MKKVISIFLIVFTLVSLCSLSAMAVASESVQPRYVRFTSIETELNISAAVARYEGSAYSDEVTDKVYVTAYLQQKVNGSWTTIGSASANANMQASAFGNCGVTSGSFFRIRVDAKVYNSAGTLLESVTEYSTEKYY